jgi:uncharacterized membrane protein
MDPTLAIALLSSAFVLTHLVLSHPPLRSKLLDRLGFGAFAVVYSVIALGIWVPLTWLWWTHRHAGALLWVQRGPVAVHLAELIAACGVALMVAAVARPPPASMASRLAGRPIEVRGAAAITRHPLFVGIALLCSAHILVNGWASDLWFMGSHVALALLGAVHQDQRHSARSEYARFMSHTTVWPDPRGLLRIDRFTAGTLVAGVVLAFVIRYAHRWF